VAGSVPRGIAAGKAAFGVGLNVPPTSTIVAASADCKRDGGTVCGHCGPEQSSFIDHAGALSGGEVLPGFKLPLAEMSARAEPPAAEAE